MENTKDDILKVIYSVISDEDYRFRITSLLNTPLVGRGATLDSLTFVSFIVAVEQKVGDAFGQKITLANSRAFSQEKNPFETLATLADYIEEYLANEE